MKFIEPSTRIPHASKALPTYPNIDASRSGAGRSARYRASSAGHATETARSSLPSGERPRSEDGENSAWQALAQMILHARNGEQPPKKLEHLEIDGRDFNGWFHLHEQHVHGYFRSRTLGVDVDLSRGHGRWRLIGNQLPVDSETLSLLRHSESWQELLGRVLADARGNGSGGLEEDDARALAEIKTLLGVEPYDDQVERLGLFVCLKHLGIDVIGSRTPVGGGKTLPLPDSTEAELIRPSGDDLAQLEADWRRLSKRLVVRRPLHLAMLAAASLSNSAKWKPDESVSNRSSISLWIPEAGTRCSLVLTGDGLHGEVVGALAKVVNARTPKPNVYYQLPHHGSAHNTNPGPSGRSTLQDALASHRGPINIRPFVTGGQWAPIPPTTRKRPHPSVLAFFKIACRRDVVCVRDTINTRGCVYKDFRLL